MHRRPTDMPAESPNLRTDVASGLAWLAEHLDRRFRWDRLPLALGVLTLIGLRVRLRERNLFDAEDPGRRFEAPTDGGAPSALGRSADGVGTHPTCPRIGAAGTRFGRNAPVVPEHDLAASTPPPRHVSEVLLQRRGDEFHPATTLNLLAAAWLQFEVHDWFSHEFDRDVVGPLGLPPIKRDADAPPTLPVCLSDQTHWWDASQLYGANEHFAATIRSDDSPVTGKVRIDEELLAAIEGFVDPSTDAEREAARPGRPVPTLWVGIAIFHVVFAREHNAICDRLRAANPRWTGDELYAKARLINVAVMAKIHTVEWTPALLAHKTTAYAIRATWWGLLGERWRRRFGRVGASEVLSGIPGSPMDDEVPYAITEEFVAVYRLHPLIPNEVTFHRARDGARMDGLDGGPTVAFDQLVDTTDERDRARRWLDRISYENAWYSLGIAYPGALTLHNYPRFEPLLSSGEKLDLGATDILRIRECGVPRYNEFRRSLRLAPATSFLALANDDPVAAREIERVYGDVEDVDLTIGMLAERKPSGFAISETAFRIFLLMAARRLRSDPFFTRDYNASVYTRVGLDWIDNACMSGILRRHYPALEPALRNVDNPFQPWPLSTGQQP